MDTAELIIPIRMDHEKAKANVQDLGQTTLRVTDRMAQGFDHATGEVKQHESALHRVGTATRSVGSEVADLMKVQFGLGALKSVGMAVVGQFNEASQKIEAMAKQFQKLRSDMNAVASLSGDTNTNKFTLKEIDAAQKANVTPQEFKQFREGFLSKASAYIGDDEGSRMTAEEAEKFQGTMAELAKKKGISESDMAQFAGGLLASTKGKTNAADLTARAGGVLNALEASSTDVKELLPKMIRVQAQGLSAEEAAPLLRRPRVCARRGRHLYPPCAADDQGSRLEGQG